MPNKRDIKQHNTLFLIGAIERLCEQLKFKAATKGGAGISLFVEAMLDIADHDGIDVARRNLDRALVMLHAMREAPHAHGMHEAVDALAGTQNEDVHRRDGS